MADTRALGEDRTFRLNGRSCEWEDGLTMSKILEKKKFTHPLLIVIINGETINASEYEKRIIKRGDDVRVIHLSAGG